MNLEAVFSTIAFVGIIVFLVSVFFDLASRIRGFLARRKMEGVHAKVTLEEMYEHEYAGTRNAKQALLRGGGHARP